VKNTVDGTEESCGKLTGKWTLFVDVAKRKETWGRKSGHFGGRTRFGTITYSEETISA
jgi:hypothetical protein